MYFQRLKCWLFLLFIGNVTYTYAWKFQGFTELSGVPTIVAKGDVEQSVYTGKFAFVPSLLGEYGLFRSSRPAVGFTIGFGLTDIRPMQWFNNLRNETGFNWYSGELHLGFSPFVGRQHFVDGTPSGDDKTFTSGIITLGVRNFRIYPPVFKTDKTEQKDIDSAQQEFIKTQKLWDKPYDGLVYSLGWVMMDETRTFSKTSLFYGDNDIGFSLEYRDLAKSGWKKNVPLWLNRNITVYFNPIGFFNSFTFLWWNNHGWYYHYTIFGIRI